MPISGKAGSKLRSAIRRESPWLCLLLLILWAWLPLTAAARDASPQGLAHGRHYTVRSWSMKDGLPHPLVHAVAQDRDGFLWVGTWEGVVRFNGRRFTLFDRQNTPGIDLSGIFDILPEADGGVLFGTARDGVQRFYKGRWQQLGNGEAARTLAVKVLLRDRRDGGLWIASGQRLLRIDKAGRLQEVPAIIGLPTGAIMTLAQQTDGSLLVGGEAGLYRVTAGHAQPWASDWGGRGVVRELNADGRGGWLLAGDDGVYWRHADGRIEHVLAGQRVDAVAVDADQTLWMNLATGQLLRRDADAGMHVMPISGTVSQALLVDRENLVWVGSTNGLFRIGVGVGTGLGEKDGLASDYVRVVLQDDTGAYWIGGTNGLDRWADGKLQRVRMVNRTGTHDTSVLALAWQQDSLWVGTFGQGVFQLDRQGRQLAHIHLKGSRQAVVRALLPNPDGSLWIGGSDGLVLYQAGKERHFLRQDAASTTVVMALYRDTDGRVWVGTDNGMAMIDPSGRVQRWRPGREIPAQFVFDFMRDPGGDLWIATDRGLLRMQGNRFRVYDHKVGLPREKLFRIIDDQAGSLWLSSNMGIFRISREELEQIDHGQRKLLSVQVVDDSDGLPGNQCNGAAMPSGWRGRDGSLLFPTSSGLAIVDPQGAVDEHMAAPPVAFEWVAVDGVQHPPGARLELAAKANRLVIGYAGMSFAAPDKLRYRYRLQGFDQDWVDADAATSLVYTRLPPGLYQLEVQAMPMPLDWSRRDGIGSVSMWINVAPAMWQRPGMQLLAAGALLALLALFWWWRTASYRRNQAELNRVIALRTEELSEKNRLLEVAAYRLQHQASHDDLTELPNRGAGDRFLIEAVATAGLERQPLCVAVLDIDHFKQVNDRYGHPVGDRVLKIFGELLTGFAAEWGMFVARFGGEEFLVCMEAFDLQQATLRMQELLQRTGALRVQLEAGETLQFTFSAGVAELAPGQTAHALLAQADTRLLQAKQAGRNRVQAD